MNKIVAITAALVLNVGLAQAEGETFDHVKVDPPPEGSVTVEQGLDAWARIYKVASHPRCSNCHVGADNRPMWSGPAYGRTRPHGMNINGGESRIGVEYVLCSTCHARRSEGGNDAPHMAPQVAADWRLAPVEAEWFGKSSDEICNQLRDPALNGDRDMLELASHLDHDVILHWAWNPGGGREPAPYSLQEHVDDILIWGVAGMPCAND
ncbi:MAG: hypothetical protein AAF429_03520 [Pseudomonadota bacterium]